MKNVLVTGGSGFLGRHLLDELLRKDYKIFAVKNKKQVPGGNQLEIIKGGLGAIDYKLVDELGVEVIFHCARPTLPRYRRTGRKVAALLAYKYNKKLLGNLEKTKIRPILLFASGSLIYGNDDLARDETSPPRPISFARQYHRGEIPVLRKIKQGNYPIRMLRFPWLLGYGSWFRWFYLDRIKNSGTVPIFGDGTNNMDIMDVRDAANLMIKYSEKNDLQGIFNISSGNIITQKEFLNQIISVYQADIKDHKEAIPEKLEKEALEAFTSNIILKSNYPDILRDYPFISIKRSLEHINDLSKESG